MGGLGQSHEAVDENEEVGDVALEEHLRWRALVGKPANLLTDQKSDVVNSKKTDIHCAGRKSTAAVDGIKDPSSAPLRNKSVYHIRAKKETIGLFWCK